MTVDDDAVAAAILELLDWRAADATICPSEVARAIGPADRWRNRMPDVRRVAAALAAAGRLRVTRGGRDVDAMAGGGPLRLGLRRQPSG